ncbi:MAG: H-type small acid-soluble spore protein [Sedimentibacter sp.]|jgi:small acid-soluble spore protein H (minor)|uniref:H-type small acid-soluble spore protein n=1 Tax=Sedimentibacter sp. TaxID=1960295 RepID=UPI003158D57B
MNNQRARDIVSSPEMINVTYNGVPVYIEKINDNNTACVHFISQPDKRQEVSVNNLIEQLSEQ